MTRPLRFPIIAALVAWATVGPATVAVAEPSSIERCIAAASRRLEVVVEQYNALREETRRSRREAEAVRARIAPLACEVSTRDAEVAALTTSAYQGGGAHPVLGLLAAGAPDELGGRLALLEHLGPGRNRAVADLATATASLTAARAALETVSTRERVQGAELAERMKGIEAEIARLDALRRGYPLGRRSPPYPAEPAARPGRDRRPVRVRAAGQAVPVGWRRPGRLRLLGADRVGVGGGRRVAAAQRPRPVRRGGPGGAIPAATR